MYNSTIFLKNCKYNVPRTNFVGVNPFCIKVFRYINMCFSWSNTDSIKKIVLGRKNTLNSKFYYHEMKFPDAKQVF